MSVKCHAICRAVEALAPKHLAEEWDNSGIQVGDINGEVDRLLVSLDVTPEIIRQAKERKVQMIVAHHPLIFRPLKSLQTNTVLGSMIVEAVKSDIVIYAAHTNLDSARAGVNQVLADKLGLQQAEILDAVYQEKLMKIVVFVPAGSEEAVHMAMSEAGAGWIGKYSHCSFQMRGTGTFMPGDNTNPYIGRQGVLEKVDEFRLETVVREKQLQQVLAAMIKAHPYEEVAYDFYELVNPGEKLGLGRVGGLPEQVAVAALAQQVKDILGCSTVKVAGDTGKKVIRAAVCGGSGAGFIQAAAAAGADVFITGDVKYHEAQEAAALGMAIIDAGHFATEHVIVFELADYLRTYAQNQGWKLEVFTAREQDVFHYIR